MRPLTGKVIGAHQKIDRLARASLTRLVKHNQAFPSSKLILRFEGVKGPDALKRKSPAKDEPWHYYRPFEDVDQQFLDTLGGHYDELVSALTAKDEIRAAFEAAWLAHAIVDGLTPAHHFPYEEKLAELRGGEGMETRTSLKTKMIMPGDTRREMLRNNWKMWGPKGLISSHGVFEWGVALMLAPMGKRRVKLTKHDILELQKYGMLGLFRRKAREVAALGVYEKYVRHGWTPPLARSVRRRVVPAIIKTVTLAWYAAAIDAGIAEDDTK
jgi:hypothetical protein